MTARYKVLLVEDDPPVLDATKETLEQENYEVSLAENGVEALALWEKEIYDLLIVDLKMPKMNGRDLLKRFVKCSPM